MQRFLRQRAFLADILLRSILTSLAFSIYQGMLCYQQKQSLLFVLIESILIQYIHLQAAVRGPSFPYSYQILSCKFFFSFKVIIFKKPEKILVWLKAFKIQSTFYLCESKSDCATNSVAHWKIVSMSGCICSIYQLVSLRKQLNSNQGRFQRVFRFLQNQDLNFGSSELISYFSTFSLTISLANLTFYQFTSLFDLSGCLPLPCSTFSLAFSLTFEVYPCQAKAPFDLRMVFTLVKLRSNSFLLFAAYLLSVTFSNFQKSFRDQRQILNTFCKAYSPPTFSSSSPIYLFATALLYKAFSLPSQLSRAQSQI